MILWSLGSMFFVLRCGSTMLAIFLAAPLAAQQAKPAPFASLAFEEACTAAKREGKIVLVDFYTTWCVPCRRLDEVTWKDAQVAAWLREKAVAIKVDAGKEERLAERFHVDSYPTILLLNSDGKVIDRLVGFRDAATFLSEVKEALVGRDEVARARERLAASPGQFELLEAYAKALARAERHSEALTEYLACVDRAIERPPQPLGDPLPRLTEALRAVGKAAPAVRGSIRALRDRNEAEVLSKIGEARTARRLAVLNEALDEPLRTVEVYDKLSGEGENTVHLRRALFGQVVDHLLRARRYADVLAGAGDYSARVDEALKWYESAKLAIVNPPEERDQFLAHAARAASERAGKFYQALLGAGRRDDAVSLADRLVAASASEEVFEVLIERAGDAEAFDVAREMAERAKRTLPPEGQEAIQRVIERVDAVAIARAKLDHGIPNDPMLRKKYGRALAEKGKHEEALAEYLWCFDEGMKHRFGYGGVRLSFLLSAIAELGESYRPALDALKERRDRAEGRMLTPPKNWLQGFIAGNQRLEAAHEFARINETLKDNERTLAVFDRLKNDEDGRQFRSVLFGEIFELLIERRSYGDVLDAVGDPAAHFDREIASYEWHARKYGGENPEKDVSLLGFVRKKAVTTGRMYYEALAGAGLHEAATALGDRALAFDATPETYVSLIRSAARAGAKSMAQELAERAKKALPEDQLKAVREAQAAIEPPEQR